MAQKGICAIPGCGKPNKSRGWCGLHYHRWERHGDPLGGGSSRVRRIPNTCSVEGCSATGGRFRNGMCAAHDLRVRTYGDPHHIPKNTPHNLTKAFVDRAINDDGKQCLLWPYGRHRFGYAVASSKRQSSLVHRIVCERVNGPPASAKLEAKHSCGNGHLGCVSAPHLSWGTRKENAEEMVAHGRSTRGERHGNHKLTTDQVIAIRSLVASGELHRVVAKQFGITRRTVGDVSKRRSWAWL